ncbi:hypothetical protein K501DRAFT_285184 [Backusella circina FSU 941]|nr:hypothetical protein K501DRAFT_285184 [Backusella circina FSU 941]
MLSFFKNNRRLSDTELFNNLKKDSINVERTTLEKAMSSNGEALYIIGKKYFQRDTKSDYLKSLDWFHKSANDGYSNAQYKIGTMYRRGYGVSKDYQKALEYYTEAANKGHEDAKKQVERFNSAGYHVKKRSTTRSKEIINSEKAIANKSEIDDIKSKYEEQKMVVKELRETIDKERTERDRKQAEIEIEKDGMAKRLEQLEEIVSQLSLERSDISSIRSSEPSSFIGRRDSEFSVSTIGNNNNNKTDKEIWESFHIR